MSDITPIVNTTNDNIITLADKQQKNEPNTKKTLMEKKISGDLNILLFTEIEVFKRKVTYKLTMKMLHDKLITANEFDRVKNILDKNTGINKYLLKDCFFMDAMQVVREIDRIHRKCLFFSNQNKYKKLNEDNTIIAGFKNQPATNFLTNNFAFLQNFIINAFLNKYPYLSKNDIIIKLQEGDLYLGFDQKTIIINYKVSRMCYSKEDIEQEANAWQAWQRFEKAFITDFAIFNFEKLERNNYAFRHLTSFYISSWSNNENYLAITTADTKSVKIPLDTIIDYHLAELNTDKLKEALEQVGIAYGDLLSDELKGVEKYSTCMNFADELIGFQS